ncbi:MAG: multidrug transporter subunit MdtA, partial [Paraburkholderia sp.]
MDEQQEYSETTRPAAPASQRGPQPSSGGGSAGGPGNTPDPAKRHRGRNIALIVAALVILGVVLWRWHPWGGPS